MESTDCSHLLIKGTKGRNFVWLFNLENHKKLVEKGEDILEELDSILRDNLKGYVDISEIGPEYFEFEFIGLKFRTMLEVNDKEFKVGMVSTYLVKERRFEDNKLIKCDSIKFSEYGALIPEEKDLGELYLSTIFCFVEHYMEKNPIALKITGS